MNPYIIIATLVVWIASLLCGYEFGRHVAAGEQATKEVAQVQQTERKTTVAQAAANAVATEIEATRADQATKDRIITKEVVRYVQVTPPADRCTLPGTWRLRHDAAAIGVPLDPGAGPLAAGADAPVEDAAALDTVADNYRSARECAAKLAGWERYNREVIGAMRRDDSGK